MLADGELEGDREAEEREGAGERRMKEGESWGWRRGLDDRDKCLCIDSCPPFSHRQTYK